MVTKSEAVLTKLGDEFTAAVVKNTGQAWAHTRANLHDPVTLERCALTCHTGAQALIQLAERLREQAGDVLDGDD
jgi:hypothetical protein